MIFCSLVSLLVSHNVGSHTAHIILFLWEYIVQDNFQINASFWSGRVPLPYHVCNLKIMVQKCVVGAHSFHAHKHVQWIAFNEPNILLVNLLRLLFLLEDLFPENKVTTFNLFIYLPVDISEQRVFFLYQGLSYIS